MTKQRKRRKLVPDNIATMTDAERYAWWDTLTDDERDRLGDRTFKVIEYWVYWADATDDGVTQGPDCYDTLADARQVYDRLLAEAAETGLVGARIEKTTGHHTVFEADLMEREFEDVCQWGRFPEDEV